MDNGVFTKPGLTYPFVVVAMAMALLAVWPSKANWASASSPDQLDCHDRTVVDFAAPLKRMRPPRHSPPVGPLTYLPASLRLDRLSPTLLVGPARVGFLLSNQSDGGRSEKNAGWESRGTLTAVRGSGAALRVIGTKRQSLDDVISGAINSMSLAPYRLPRQKGFYRLDLVLQRGAETHGYREYFRVLPRRVDLRLALSDHLPVGGERLTWRLENFGTTPVLSGLDYRIERLEEGDWVTDPLSPGSFPKVGYSMGAGDAGRCQSLQLPVDMELGRYRLSKSAFTGSRRHRVFSEFTVSAP